MEIKKILTRISPLLFCLILAACSKDDGIHDDNFEIPPFTDQNTIQFTVTIERDGWKQMEIYADGGRIAIDWGDGRLQRIEDPFHNRPRHQYGKIGKYRVKVWAEELEFCNLGDVLLPIENLRLGYLPKMKNLLINTCNATSHLDLSSSCPNITSINIGNCADLEQIDLSGCPNLKDVSIYTNPKLQTLDLSHNPLIEDRLLCSGNGLTTLSVKGLSKIREIECFYSPNLSTLELDEENKNIHTIQAGDCNFTSMDFLNQLPNLSELGCSKNHLSTLDLSQNPHISYLHCEDNELTELILPKVPENYGSDGCLIRSFFCHSNQLSTQMLNEIFDRLGTIPSPEEVGKVIVCKIAYWGNPGSDNCNKELLINKKWTIEAQPLPH